MGKKRILSGMRPTAPLHLGNYLGALQNWVALQDEYDCFFMSADWHALTSEYRSAGNIQRFARENIAEFIAAGVDPEKSTVFIQSNVPEHTELHMILSCLTPLGWLERVPTYKAQVKELESKGVDNYAFLGYPVLQAADIFLYKGEAVPVGEDQLPHLELTREIARRFNSIFGKQVFPEPKAKLTEIRLLLGLDGRKMSGSYGNGIEIGEEPATVEKKVKSMFTDPARVRRKDPGTPEKCNVWTFHSIFNTAERHAKIADGCRSAEIGCTDCKTELAGKVQEHLSPIYEKRKQLLENPKELDEIIHTGTKKARIVARETMEEVREAVFNSR
jgi:tryptophanyl-tRNA synthetase